MRLNETLPQQNQPSLFGSDLSGLTCRDRAGQPALSIEARKAVIEEVYHTADEGFIASYRAFLIAFAATVTDFIAGDVTTAYEAKHGKLTVREGKQLGGLFQALQRDGVIEKTGEYRARNQGNASAVYRRKK